MKTLQVLAMVPSLIFIMINTSGCAVSMATNAPPKKDVTVLNVGTERLRVVAELGVPVLAEEMDGKKVDTFNFIQGYSSGSKAGRAFFHGAADLMTIGLWEVVGTPIENSMDGTEVQVVVYYDENDLVERIKVYQGEEKLKGVNSDSLPASEPDGDETNLKEIEPDQIQLIVIDRTGTSAPLGG